MNTEKLAETFVDLADSLVEEFDALDLLNVLVDRCVDLLGITAAGLLFADGHDRLRLTVSSSESARILELYQLQNDEGPCFECYRSGQPVFTVVNDEEKRWPRFVEAAASEGFAGVLALPLRLRRRVIGALNLFDTTDDALTDDSVVRVAQAMADVATIAILQHRFGRERDVLNEQLQIALNSRVVIEQAKGVLATRRNLEMGEAFEVLRKRSRDERRPLVAVAEEVVTGASEGAAAARRDQN